MFVRANCRLGDITVFRVGSRRLWMRLWMRFVWWFDHSVLDRWHQSIQRWHGGRSATLKHQFSILLPLWLRHNTPQFTKHIINRQLLLYNIHHSVCEGNIKEKHYWTTHTPLHSTPYFSLRVHEHYGKLTAWSEVGPIVEYWEGRVGWCEVTRPSSVLWDATTLRCATSLIHNLFNIAHK